MKCLVQVRSNKAKRFKLVDSGLFIRAETKLCSKVSLQDQ